MEYHIGVEDIEPGNWVAWVFELPGCYARASLREEAVRLVPDAIADLLTRLRQSGFATHEAQPPFRIQITEEFRGIASSPDYIINAFFENDRLPLTDEDIEYAEHLLGLNRDELNAIISDLSNSALDREIPGEVQKNVRGILRHIGTAEWWYWDRLGLAFSREERPEGISELLPKIRQFTLLYLPGLAGSGQIATKSGETWSPRKLVRRAIWHERVHTLQIARYLTQKGFLESG